jgi:hypothetical protein
MSNRTKIIAGAIALACLTLTGCVSEGGGYSRGGSVGYNPVYDRSDRGPHRNWNNRRDHDRGSRNDRDRNDRGRPGYNRAADARDKPNPTWANNNISRDRDRDRNNRPDRNNGGRPGDGRPGDSIIIRNR